MASILETLFPGVKAETLIKRIEVHSAYGPDIVLTDPFAGPSTPNPVMQRLQPRIVIDVQGLGPLEFNPYGKPPPTKWPLIEGALIAGGIVGATLLGLGLYGVARGR